jgi:hypothetical protein
VRKTVKGVCFHAFYKLSLGILIFSLDLFWDFIFDIISRLMFQALRANRPTLLRFENIVKNPQKSTIF